MATQNNHKGITRRRFLSGLAVASAASVVGTSLLAPRKAMAATDAITGFNGEVLCGSHWGAFRAKVVNGVWTETTPFEKDKNPTDMIKAVREVVYNPARVKYPMIRIDWLKQGYKSDTTQRGNNRFVRVPWSQALDFLYHEMERVQNNFGPSALYAGHTGWQSVGKLHNAGTMMKRGVSLHGTTLGKMGDYSTGAAQVILPYVAGAMEVYEQQTSWPLVLEHTDTIVMWASDPIKNLQVGWLVPDHSPYQYYEQLAEKVKNKEIKVIYVDPVVSCTQKAVGGEQIRVNPQTDVPLMLAIAHTLYTENLYNKEFVADYTTGLDKFMPYVLGETDGITKNPEWAEKICGIKADDIRALARTMAKGRTQIIGGWCLQRMQHGEQYAWMLVVLAAMLGQIGLPGGGFGFGWHYNDAGSITSNGPLMSGFSGVTGVDPIHSGSYDGYSTFIPVARFVDCIDNPGKTIDYNGQKIKYPFMKMAIFSGNNPFGHHQDRNKMIKAWTKLQTVVSIDHQWTATCRFADIVLPATTTYERNDIEQYGNHSNAGIIALRKVVEPMYESKDDYEIFSELCSRYDREEAFTGGKTQMEWIEEIYNGARLQGRGLGVRMPNFKKFWDGEGFIEFPAGKEWVRHESFRSEPDLEPLGTASGLIEIYCKTIADMGYNDCQGHPMWFEKTERSHGGPRSDRFPINMQSTHPKDRLHSQLCSSTDFRATYAVADREPIFINTEDAKARGIQSGDIVRVYNDRGQVMAGAVVTDDYLPGVCRLQEGAWYSPLEGGKVGTICTYGDPNVLTEDIGSSSLAQATSAAAALVQIEKYTGPVHAVTGFNGPTYETGIDPLFPAMDK
ncbi:trimethylamine-N-oxide reductase TorA [Photobacterium kishitanii]|uniref:Trimethylamine-N-oxide reductase n=1 Tax=Photobacterium kishitanii TaxID=318456 RepID=A0A0B7JC88_9GAMM|nr:trimethylamine-N-oxide reductase TorA [Photobacterium kishitanii]PSU93692.1 trimethylamine-N-oxide reductase TorA [Photobacterium kishitanii]PSU98945.1 trimethylamine-N-oxide reductase TorA [Photobacterium kishitanii]PSV20727.1 trimethylamine-N-oxide reductase TorA [Photobacterium kishitanii]CEO38968.1 Periplasmic trimethylamine N-oxide (TMAO) reductase I, catalytic subunit, Tat substrate [Photobacterium kishitanii]